MTNPKQAQSSGLRRTALAAAVAAACMGVCAGANAFEVDTGNDDMQVRFDNTVRYNLGYRVEKQDPAVLANPNNDDGDRNFKRHSIVMNRVDLLSELDVVYQKKFGARVSAASWYDRAYSGNFDNTSLATSNHLVNGAPAFGLSNYANRYYNGLSGEWLDAFVFGTVDLGNMPLTVRAGRHNVYWGEALANPVHGINYGQAPLDLAKAQATPGVEVKELARPRAQLSGQLQATSDLSIAGQYFFKWEAARLPEAGTYYGAADLLQRGGESLILAPGVRALHGRDIGPKGRGDWGLAARWSPEWLDGTLGFYARNFSDILPQTILMGAAPRQYFLNYADDIDMYGVSLTRNIAGVSFGMDLNYRKNMPLASDSIVITSLARLPAHGDVLGARGETLHGVFNVIGTVNSTPMFDSASWNAELAWSRLLSVTNDPNNVFKGRTGYTAIDRVSKDFFGVSLGFTPTWFQIFPGADLSMPVNYSRGLSGNSTVSSGGNKYAGSWSVGLALDLYSKYRFDLKYVDAFGHYTVNSATGAVAASAGAGALLNDRGALYATFKTSF
ncbi:DUF1302 domain-containing protein [Noviherbaspirillum saxi]|uniref:DUF1302 domain-containing protein n=1 Tax=Noviherbaspirillum saxi TaxID=2320863 RepID=A0A3A3FF20_9BURK|nr:DUF1302 domain-containing protein [Noviherbaspirillum saxi]RJF91840.1 DUF1302 domain-containing protein [Noviherbaspirillum saxi]